MCNPLVLEEANELSPMVLKDKVIWPVMEMIEKSSAIPPESNFQGGESSGGREKRGLRNNQRRHETVGRESDYPRTKSRYWFYVHVEVAPH